MAVKLNKIIEMYKDANIVMFFSDIRLDNTSILADENTIFNVIFVFSWLW